MPLTVLVVPDKFKGTLTAPQAADAIARGWLAVRPQDRLDRVPMSDGGDGFGDIIGRLFGALSEHTPTEDAAHRPIEADWWWDPATRTAVVESARVIGLARLPPGRFTPLDLDTTGLGAVLRAVSAKGARHTIAGIGGSATNDGGFGMARALGWRFVDDRGAPVTRWIDLERLADVQPPSHPIQLDDLVVAVDVRNPLLGPSGSSRVYGPQKGLVDVDMAERALSRLAAVMTRHTHHSHELEAGAGAAGGLGFGLLAFAGARVEMGIDIFKRCAGLEARVRAVQLVITGEGSLDAQSMMGKGVGDIAALCRRLGVPCIGLAGTVENPAAARPLFDATYALVPDLTDRASALSDAARWLEHAASGAARRVTETGAADRS